MPDLFQPHLLAVLALCSTALYSWLAPLIAQSMQYQFHREWSFFAKEVDPSYEPPAPPSIQTPSYKACYNQAPFRLALSLMGHFAWAATFANSPVWTQSLCLLALHAVILGCYVDMEAMLIPDTLNFSAIWLPVVAALIDNNSYTLRHILTGILVGYCTLWTVIKLFHLVRGKDGMGAGDFKLMAALLALSPSTLMPYITMTHIILVASLSFCAHFAINHLCSKASSQDPMPFGPHLLFGWAAVILGTSAL